MNWDNISNVKTKLQENDKAITIIHTSFEKHFLGVNLHSNE